MKAFISLALAGLLSFSTYASAQPNKELYELQERCGKRAAEVFEREYIQIPNNKLNYENHYNARLNKCFYLEISISYDRQDGKPTIFTLMRLYDLNDNKEYGR